MRILIVKPGGIGDILHALPAVAAVSEAMPNAEISRTGEPRSDENLGDNPLLDRLIEVGTRALRRGLMSGETLRAPRQQLRRLRASAFVLDFQGLLNPPQLRAFLARSLIFGFSLHSLREPAGGILLSKSVSIPKKCHVIRKNVFLVEGALEISVQAPLHGSL